MSKEPSKDQVSECPHCGVTLKRWQTPVESTWGGEIRLVCFNDDCPYFVRGWQVMMERQAVSASYRAMVNPVNGATSPLPVWSKNALRDGIVD